VAVGNDIISDVFSKLLENSQFKDNYFLGFLDRFVYTTTDLEGDLNPEARKLAIENLLKAFNYLMDLESEKMFINDLVAVGDFINQDNGISGLRKIHVSAGKYADWVPVYPPKLYNALYSLFNNYYNVWIDRDVYEKEAAFHIELMRIHPFEDGNKRTAKILMNANFVKQNYPPVIITEEDTEAYYEFINNEDITGFAKFLKSKSLQEFNVLISLYKLANNIPITKSVVDIFSADGAGGRK